MIYTLADGRNINIGEVKSVSSIRDYGDDPNMIGMCRFGFAIYMKDSSTVRVSEHYHYADWVEVRARLNAVRTEILRLVEQSG